VSGQLLPRPVGDPLKLLHELGIQRIVRSVERIQCGLAGREQDAEHGDVLLRVGGDER